jgi:hypothetical protein
LQKFPRYREGLFIRSDSWTNSAKDLTCIFSITRAMNFDCFLDRPEFIRHLLIQLSGND